MNLKITEQLNDTKRVSIPSKQLKVHARDIIEIDGQYKTRVSPQGFKDLLNIIGLNEKTINHFNQEVDEKAGFTLVKVLMESLAAKKGLVVDLLISEQDGEIKRIATEGLLQKSLNPSIFEELIDYGVGKSKGKLIVTDQFITDGGTKASVNLKWNEPIGLKLKGEDINIGKQLQWDLLGPTTYGDMIERLICTNGMTTTRVSDFKQLNAEADPSEWYQLLFNDLVNPNKKSILDYEQNVLQAMTTNLSVYEFNKLYAHCANNWSDDMGKVFRYFGDPRSWKEDYDKKNIKLDELNAFQLRNCPTPVKAWDALNCLTDLASHDYVTVVPDKVKLETQRYAGQLLNNSWNAYGQVYNVPQYN